MATPEPERYQKTLGRRGRCSWHVQWTQQDSDDLENEIVLSLDDLSGRYNDGRYGVLTIDWTASLNVAADIEFDSAPMQPEGRVLSIPIDASSGHLDFAMTPDGCIADPEPTSPGNLVISTRWALPDDEVTLFINYKEKGTDKLGEPRVTRVDEE